jgi:hypothetical protein
MQAMNMRAMKMTQLPAMNMRMTQADPLSAAMPAAAATQPGRLLLQQQRQQLAHSWRRL